MDLSTTLPPVPVIMGASVWVLWAVGATAGVATVLIIALIVGGWH
jgi:hypothetical protein